MQVPLKITARNTEISPAEEEAIQQRASKLEAIYGRLMSCRVAVEVPHRHRRSGASYTVRVDITVPGGELIVDRKPGDTLISAIQKAFAAAERKLRKFAARQRGEVKSHESPQPVAKVREIYPLGEYGFLGTPDGHTVYFDARSVVDGAFERLAVGAAVRFVQEEGEKGPQASTVIPVG